jgi:transcriptional regulator with XRE-family HTH domain
MATPPLPGAAMPPRSRIDLTTRRRIAAWIRVEMEDRGVASAREFARTIGVSAPYLSRILSGDQTPGLELVLRLTRKLGLSADRLLNEEPSGCAPTAAEPVAQPSGAEARPPRGVRRIDPERWLARARAVRALTKRPPTDAEVSRAKRAGRP